MSQIETYLPAHPPDTTRHVLELVGFGLTLAYVLSLADSAIHRYWLGTSAAQCGGGQPHCAAHENAVIRLPA